MLMWSFLSVELLIIFFFSLNQLFGLDEVESIHNAWKILSGQRIYVDFFEHHHPLFYYLLVPFVAIFKENVMVMIAGRVSIFLVFLLILTVTYKVAKDLFGKESAVIGIVLLSFAKIFIIRVTQIRPEVPQTLFELLSLSLLFSYFRNKSIKYLFLSAASLAVSFLFLQTTVFFILPIGILLIYNVFTFQIRLKDVFLFFLMVAAVLMPFGLYLVFSGQWHNYSMYNWVLNTRYLKPSGHDILSLFSLLLDEIFVWTLWFLSLLFLDNVRQKGLAIVSLVFLIMAIMLDFGLPQYYKSLH